MKIKIRDSETHKFISVDVSHSNCVNYQCFFPHKWTTQSQSYNHVQTDKHYSCGTRNYHGCPDIKTLKDDNINTHEKK